MTAIAEVVPAELLARRAAESQVLNAADAVLACFPQVECRVVHAFTKGMYIRECHVPAGTVLTSKIHKTNHPFVITAGDISVWTEGQGWVRHKAPYKGITEPGTRRLLFAHEDTIWTTYHPNPDDETDLDVIEAFVIHKHDHFNPQLIQEALKQLPH